MYNTMYMFGHGDDIPIRLKYETVVELAAIYSKLRGCSPEESTMLLYQDPDLIVNYVLQSILQKPR